VIKLIFVVTMPQKSTAGLKWHKQALGCTKVHKKKIWTSSLNMKLVIKYFMRMNHCWNCYQPNKKQANQLHSNQVQPSQIRKTETKLKWIRVRIIGTCYSFQRKWLTFLWRRTSSGRVMEIVSERLVLTLYNNTVSDTQQLTSPECGKYL
jgi:hypothetical protein